MAPGVDALSAVLAPLVASEPQRAAALAAALADTGVALTQLEASVRGAADGAVRGGRMMVENASVATVRALAVALQLPPCAELDALVRAAAAAALPLIAGWDEAGAEPLVKLYVNGSDASVAVRAAVAAAVGWPGLGALPAVPHLLAINATRTGVERKAYLQSADAARAAEPFGEPAARLARCALERDAAAGAVGCWAIEPRGTARARAYFVALRDADDRADPLLCALPGWDAARVARLVPFEHGRCRSVGVPAGAGAPWTAYFKPRAPTPPLWDLEPWASFRAGDVEVAVFLAPRDHGPRAYARTARHAISFRARQGAPVREVLEPLMRWVVQQVARAEREPGPLGPLPPPPAPWQRAPG